MFKDKSEPLEFIMHQDLRESPDLSIAYSDDDLLVIDSIKEVEENQLVRIGMYVIPICLKGKVQFESKGEVLTISERQLVIIPPGTTLENPMTSPDYDFRFVCLTSNIINTQLHSYLDIWNQAIYSGGLRIHEMSEYDMQRITMFFTLLKMTLESSYASDRYRKDIIHSLLKAGLVELCSTLEKSVKSASQKRSHAESIFQQFLDMINSERDKRQCVAWYAGKLCISPKYLTALCMKYSGKTAKQWIDECISESVRLYLKSTDMSMKEIAFRLGFPNTSYFSRYVKKTFGMSPLAFRSEK